jgi:hypothetical protein
LRELAAQKAQIEEQVRKLEARKALIDNDNKIFANPLTPAGPTGPRARRADDEPKSANEFKLDVPRPKLQAAKLPRYEYKVLTLPDRDEEANAWLAKNSDEGWDYVAVVQSQNGAQVHQGARLLFKRVKK